MSYAANGARVTQAQLNALTEDPPESAEMRVMTADVYQQFTYDNASTFEGGQRLLFRDGQLVSQATLDALFADATVATVTPATGAAAGGTDVVIRGTNFGGVVGVTVGGAAATMVAVVDENTLTCRTPAHAAGTVDVIVTDDSGAVTKTGGFVYT